MMGGGLGAMMGGGGMGFGGGIGTGIGSMIRQQAMAGAMDRINEAVHFIVGSQASPDNELLQFALGQRGPPTTMMQMMAYLPHMQRIARATYGAWLADMAKQTAATPAAAEGGTASPTSGTSITASTVANSTLPTGGKTLAELQTDLDAVIMERSVMYMDRNISQGGGGNGGVGGMGGANMAQLGTMIPAMIQGIQAMYM